MHVAMLLEMAADALPDRVALGDRTDGTTFGELATRARRVAAHLKGCPGERVGLIDLNSAAVPLTVFGAAFAGKALVPISYRLVDDALRAIVERIAPATIVVGPGVAERLGSVDGVHLIEREALLDVAADEAAAQVQIWSGDLDDIAVLLFTSGTTGEPKAAVLRHRHVAGYVLSTVELASAAADEAALVSVPPYHIAGISAVLSGTYRGRRTVQLEAFEPERWVALAQEEEITHAMVVPTMLSRILDVVETVGRGLPALRHLSYGGGPMPAPLIERAMRVLPGVGFVNAYGLTETSSTIAVLDADDHVAAFESSDPSVRARLGSVGRALPSVEISIRGADGEPVPTGARGEIWVRGDQVAGEYLGRSGLGDLGWFHTNDGGHIDDDGYLYVHGRLDDVIVRGGENLSPGEIEAALLEHPAVSAAAVVGVPDTEWGESVAAAVVLRPGRTTSEPELQEHVRARLRSAKTPARIKVCEALPFNETGKLLRRVLRDELAAPDPDRAGRV